MRTLRRIGVRELAEADRERVAVAGDADAE